MRDVPVREVLEREVLEREVLVERTGALVTIQDRGRIGLAHLGVPRSGAADRASLGRANRLVGNTSRAAGLEVLLGGLRLAATTSHLLVAVTGAGCPLTLDGRPVAGNTVLDLPPGGVLELGIARTGLRAYVAFRGGLAVPAVLASRSWDTLAGLGPEPVQPGQRLPVGPSAPYTGPDVEGWPLLELTPALTPPGPDDVLVLRAAPGPRLGLLDGASASGLWRHDWRVSPDSDRVGVRLDGPPLARTPASAGQELASEPLVRGAVQVPPGGRPVVFLADHPVTGGYPVVAVVLDADTDLLAQARPGSRVLLRRPSPPRGSVRPGLDCPWWGW